MKNPENVPVEGQARLQRLRAIAGDRDMWPWLQSLGLTKGTIGRIRRGQRPSRDLLLMLQLAERVLLPWLETGTGPPYLVRTAADRAALGAVIEDLTAQGEWSLLLVEDGADGHAAILHRWARHNPPPRKGSAPKRIAYRAVEVIGPLTPAQARALPIGAKAVRQLRLDGETFSRLVRGQLGNSALFGFADPRKQRPGLVARALTLPASALQRTPIEATRARLAEQDHSPACEEPPEDYAAEGEGQRIARFSALPDALQIKLLQIAEIIGEL